MGRAEIAKVLIPRDEWHPLDGGSAPEYIPPAWDGPHVGRRLADAFATLSQLPTPFRKSRSGFWPTYYYEWEDLVAQKTADAATQEDEASERNRTRVCDRARKRSAGWKWRSLGPVVISSRPRQLASCSGLPSPARAIST
jgi:hypothetical protein